MSVISVICHQSSWPKPHCHFEAVQPAIKKSGDEHSWEDEVFFYAFGLLGNDKLADNGRRSKKRSKHQSCRTPECHCVDTRGKIDREVSQISILRDISVLCCGREAAILQAGLWKGGKVQGSAFPLTRPGRGVAGVTCRYTDDGRVVTYGELKVRQAVCVSRARSLAHPKATRGP